MIRSKKYYFLTILFFIVLNYLWFIRVVVLLINGALIWLFVLIEVLIVKKQEVISLAVYPKIPRYITLKECVRLVFIKIPRAQVLLVMYCLKTKSKSRKKEIFKRIQLFCFNRIVGVPLSILEYALRLTRCVVDPIYEVDWSRKHKKVFIGEVMLNLIEDILDSNLDVIVLTLDKKIFIAEGWRTNDKIKEAIAQYLAARICSLKKASVIEGYWKENVTRIKHAVNPSVRDVDYLKSDQRVVVPTYTSKASVRINDQGLGLPTTKVVGQNYYWTTSSYKKSDLLFEGLKSFKRDVTKMDYALKQLELSMMNHRLYKNNLFLDQGLGYKRLVNYSQITKFLGDEQKTAVQQDGEKMEMELLNFLFDFCAKNDVEDVELFQKKFEVTLTALTREELSESLVEGLKALGIDEDFL